MPSSAANVAPTAVTLSTATYTPPTATANVVVGTLSSSDVNCCQTFTYSIVGGLDAALFNISGSSLRITASGQRGTGLQVTVRSTDSGQPALFRDQTFTINDGTEPACCLVTLVDLC